MAYSVTIGTFTFPVTTAFTEQIQNVVDGANCITESTEIIRITGKVAGATASDAFDRLDELRAVALVSGAQTVEIKLDNVTRRLLSPANSVEGPHVMDFQDLGTPGSKANHITFSFVVRVKLALQTLAGTEVTNVDRVIEQRFSDDTLSQKTWRIIVKAATIEEAEALVASLAPNVPNLDTVLIKRIDKNTMEGVFVWNRPQDTDQVLIQETETMTVQQGGKPLIPVQVTGAIPVIRKGQIRPWIIRFENRIRFISDSFVNAAGLATAFFEAHYDEADLDPTGSDTFSDPMLMDPIRGEYQVITREMYVFAEEPASPDHGNHLDPAEPGDDPSDEPDDNLGGVFEQNVGCGG